MEPEDKQEVIKRFRSNTYKLVVQILITFGLSATIGGLTGTYLDRMYSSKPRFLAICLGISYVVAWTVIIQLRKSFKTKSDPLEKQIRAQ